MEWKQREILFRGKNIDLSFQKVSMWAYGYYARDLASPLTGTIRDEEPIYYVVEHNTVTQYTGLKDCKGQKIFEGDIIKAIHSGVGFVGVVQFKNSGFQVFNPIKDISCFNFDIPTDWEIVGNILDTPEFFESNHS